MKKTILTTIVALFVFTIGANAQGLDIGIKAGLNMANLSVEDADYDNRLGIHGGAFVNIRLGGIGIQPELLYSAQGAEFGSDAVTKINYIYVPVIAKIYLGKIVNLQAGPQFGMVGSAKTEIGDVEQDIKDDIKNSTFDIALGGGLDLPFGLTADVRYIIGLSDINDGLGDEAQNRVFQVSLGYKLISLGK